MLQALVGEGLWNLLMVMVGLMSAVDFCLAPKNPRLLILELTKEAKDTGDMCLKSSDLTT